MSKFSNETNAIDMDSDKDKIQEMLGNKNNNGIFEPEYGETNPYNPDTDAYRNQPTAIPNQPPLS